MADEDPELDMEPGDFLYQSDQELFYVLMRESDHSYLFSVHGWRDIDKERAVEYVDGEHGKLYREEQIEQVMEDEASDEATENYEKLKKLFRRYSKNFDDSGLAENFSMEDK